jgi:hypothetical protein
MKPPLLQGAPDDFQTPPEALLPLYKYLKPRSSIWECACGEGALVYELEARKFKVIATDLYARPSRDFLAWEPTKPYDYIVTNPPYSKKQQFLTRCYELGKPFALLLPLTTLETSKRQALFAKYGVEIIFFSKRINFVTPNKTGTSSWFATAWFTHGLNIGRQMTFL